MNIPESEPKSEVLAGLWNKYLNLELKYAKGGIPPPVVEQLKDTFYMGATAMFSLCKAALVHSQTSDDLQAIRWWMLNIEKELHEHLRSDVLKK